MAMRIAAEGFVVVNLDYGLAPEHPYPWAVEDTVYATQWLARNAATYQGIGSGLFLGGDLAGANLVAAAVVALATGRSTTHSPEVAAPASITVAGLLLLYGVFDFPLLFSKPGKISPGTIETTLNLAYLGPNFVGVHRDPLVSPAYWSEASRFPPSYLSCGAEDSPLPQTLRMTEVLTEAGVPTMVSILEGEDHSFLLLADFDETAASELQRLGRWMKKHAVPGQSEKA